jgi:hypothetical protein
MPAATDFDLVESLGLLIASRVVVAIGPVVLELPSKRRIPARQRKAASAGARHHAQEDALFA